MADLFDERHVVDAADDSQFLGFVSEGGVAELIVVVFLAALVHLVADVMLDADSFVKVLRVAPYKVR